MWYFAHFTKILNFSWLNWDLKGNSKSKVGGVGKYFEEFEIMSEGGNFF